MLSNGGKVEVSVLVYSHPSDASYTNVFTTDLASAEESANNSSEDSSNVTDTNSDITSNGNAAAGNDSADGSVAAAGDANANVSPKTGESPIAYILAAALIAGGTVIITTRKRSAVK